jgi:hypothetical protein
VAGFCIILIAGIFIAKPVNFAAVGGVFGIIVIVNSRKSKKFFRVSSVP